MDVVFFPTRHYSIIIGRVFFPNATVEYYYWTWFFQLEYDYYNLTFIFLNADI